ncbi:ATP-dependent RNA helicase RhlE [Oceaniferula spumae]|uniref:ATP-dependent RNA helicase RhlE n=1 Tax=Oceaniferula spumae TaxID=2979115 RepID=A0AAT9FK92_9BACT
MSFSSLGITSSLLTALGAQGLTSPTPIQQEAIPAALKGRDILGVARTGSGKTASYVLPILERLPKSEATRYREPAVLILVPTRELALQVHGVFEDFLPAIQNSLRCLAVHGGVSINPQMKAIGKADIIVCTPGRLIDLVEKNAVKLSSITTLVLDEADKMLNLGFKLEVDRILSLLPKKRQTLLFSATLNPDLDTVQQELLNDPLVIKISEDTLPTGQGEDHGHDEPVELINQLGYFVPDEKKGPLLRYLINQGDLQQVLVFASSIRMVDTITNKLSKNNIDAAAVHSKISQQYRQENLRLFKSGKLRVLVTTDLLARGIDIDFLPCVINYELPRSPKDYIHRIGRTGRAGSPGDAISLISPDEMHHFRVIQKKMGKRVKMLESEDLNLHGH